MAGANLPAKMYKKTNPTITRLSFELSGDGTKFIDIGRALSALNRKAFRQGVYYYVNSVECYNNEDGFVDLHTLPDTWVTKNAWNRAFKLFQKMNAQVSTPRPKYHDFKVYMSDRHRQQGDLNPDVYGITDGTGNTLTENVIPDEWAHSQFVSMDNDGDITTNSQGQTVLNQEADNFYVHMLGGHVGNSDNWTSVGLIKSYADTRREPDQSGDPIIPSEFAADPLVNLFDSSEETINDLVERLDQDNDRTPYDADLYLGERENNMVQVARLATSISSGRVSKSSGFCVPFGLICVDPASSISSDYRIVINLAQGTYHGVYAERA